jgi:hypothetical protein
MYTLINLNHPLRSSIILYLIILAIIVVYRPELIKNKKSKFMAPVVILLVSILSYYIFAMLSTLV